MDDDTEEEPGQDPPNPDAETPRTTPKSTKKHLAVATAPSAETSLQILDASLPRAPKNGPSTQTSEIGDWELSPWLRQALVGVEAGSDAWASAGPAPLIARLPALAQRMRSILQRGLYGRNLGEKESGGAWAEDGRPAGFVGAGLAEELCLAIFGRIGALRSKGVGKQVRVVYTMNLFIDIITLYDKLRRHLSPMVSYVGKESCPRCCCFPFFFAVKRRFFVGCETR